jgi:hypothetical protein
MHISPRLRTLTAVGAAVAGLGAFSAPAAHASLLGGLLPGILSPKTAAATCPVPVQSFKQFGDSTWYQLANGGSFEGQNSWKLSGGASVVADQEPWKVADADDASALSLPRGASALSPASCFAFGDVKMRMFVKGTGKVRVNIVVTSLVGSLLGVLDGGTIQAGQTWQPSPQLSLLLSSVGGLLVTDSIQLRLTSVDGDVVVDDVYIDPFKVV